MATLSLRNINKVYPNGTQAVFDFNLEIADKDFVCFVGPSGCGKSTTLRMIAGLEDISSGDLLIDGVRMNDVAPKNRDIAMCFQSYALYPHMSVYENLAFGLRLRRVDRREINHRVREASHILGLDPYLQRKPRDLSGGQQQRVALGRAIVRHARVFLMDEPLSNLDAKLRVSTRGELIKLHKRLNATTIYVTHDQIEAMTMATKIVVMKLGRIQQVGIPKEIYNHPANVFVGGFIGTPPMNFINGSVSEEGIFTTADGTRIEVPAGKLELIKEKGFINKPLFLGIRPEDIHDESEPIMFETYPNAVVDCKVKISELLGSETNIYTEVSGCSVIAAVPSRSDLTFDSDVKLVFDMNKCHFFDESSEMNLEFLDSVEK
ncbi:MAG: sn-glycerol-3-phosphate ABC transporter ATP-binding protein UgpC [Acholeplasmatales bacterium]|nr:sn-glycerol-3-phosphate ABC transporter ATP-binding protein UgpC [Acholeplasmatales bacterium]